MTLQKRLDAKTAHVEACHREIDNLNAQLSEARSIMVKQNQLISRLSDALQKAHDEEGVCSCGDKCLLIKKAARP